MAVTVTERLVPMVTGVTLVIERIMRLISPTPDVTSWSAYTREGNVVRTGFACGGLVS